MSPRPINVRKHLRKKPLGGTGSVRRHTRNIRNKVPFLRSYKTVTREQNIPRIPNIADGYIQKHSKKYKLENTPQARLSKLKEHELAMVRGRYWVEYNEDRWKEYYSIDPERANRCLEFVTAHELWHSKRGHYKHGAGFKPDQAEEDNADMFAAAYTKIKISQYEKDIQYLESRRKKKKR